MPPILYIIQYCWLNLIQGSIKLLSEVCHYTFSFLWPFITGSLGILPLSSGYQQNSLAEKEVFAGLILVGNHLVKDKGRC